MNHTRAPKHWIAACLLCIAPCVVHGQTATPAGDEVVQRVPAQSDARVHRYIALKQQLSAAPGDVAVAVELANAYIDFGRQTGDVRYLGFADAVLKPWAPQDPMPESVAVSHATILQSRHQFIEARKLLEAITQRTPLNVQAWLTLASVAQVQGDMQTANHACVQSVNAGGPFFGIACTAQLRLATGHPDQSYILLQQIAMGATGEPDTVKAWVEGLLADAANYQGHADDADAHFKKALSYVPGDNFLLSEYADFLLDQGRAQEAFDLTKDDVQSDTSYLRMAFAAAALKHADSQAIVWTMAARFAAMEMVGSALYQREQSRFALILQHDAQKALSLAQENWSVQRAPWDVRIYLEAALAAGQPQAAQPALDFIASTNLHTVIVDALVARTNAAIAAHKAVQ